mmetsp:Transcript_12358/g.23446  ORF Transcript_12358/g.23446 Transcript_12358/m.23446 type:complete len:151 (-) Transcript_12358:387-839(-)
MWSQIYVTIKKGKAWPPLTIDVRVKYEETIGTLRKKTSLKAKVPEDKLQLFWHRKELLPAVYDHLTLAQMRIHTGFSFECYDLTEEPEYWPPVYKSESGGLVIMAPITNSDYLKKNPDAINEKGVLKMEKFDMEAAPGVKATKPIKCACY